MLPAIGVPVLLAVYIGPEALLRYPWAALGLLLSCEVTLAIVRFKAGVGAGLHARWSEALASRTDNVVKRLAADPERMFVRHLRLEHGCATVQGLAAQGTAAPALERVFVEPSLVPSLAKGYAMGPVPEVPEAWSQGAHTIWDYVQARSLQGVSLAIVGPPGSGKTALLKHTVLGLAAGWRKRRKLNAPDRLPVLLSLHDCAAAIVQAGGSEMRRERASSPIDGSEQEVSLPQIIQDSLTKAQGPKIPERWFETRLQRGRCLVMLDGLGQVADPVVRKQVVRWVDNQIFIYPKTRFVITSRPLAYRSSPIGGDVTVLRLQPLDRDQVDRLVRKGYPESDGASQRVKDQEPARAGAGSAGAGAGAAEAAGAGAADLLTRIWNSPALARLACNPMHLAMMISLHCAGRPLPGRRAELYAEILERILDVGQAARGQEILTPAQVQTVLQSLAYHMMRRRQHEMPWTQVMEAIGQAHVDLPLPELSAALLEKDRDGKGLLLERNNGSYGFAHRTFQEYLAAAHVRECGQKADLVRHVIDPWWVQAIRLYAAQADASEIILACLAADPPAAPALDLAIGCMQVTPGVRQPARERLERALDKAVEDDDPERRRIVAQALLDRHLQGLVQLDDGRSVDHRLITHAEYQLFLDEQRAKGRIYQPDHWPRSRFPRGGGKMPVVGVRFSDAWDFCEWLTRRSRGGWRYRLPEANELAPQDVVDSYSSLVRSIGRPGGCHPKCGPGALGLPRCQDRARSDPRLRPRLERRSGSRPQLRT
jgi:hypothetical protein